MKPCGKQPRQERDIRSTMAGHKLVSFNRIIHPGTKSPPKGKWRFLSYWQQNDKRQRLQYHTTTNRQTNRQKKQQYLVFRDTRNNKQTMTGWGHVQSVERLCRTLPAHVPYGTVHPITSLFVMIPRIMQDLTYHSQIYKQHDNTKHRTNANMRGIDSWFF